MSTPQSKEHRGRLEHRLLSKRLKRPMAFNKRVEEAKRPVLVSATENFGWTTLLALWRNPFTSASYFVGGVSQVPEPTGTALRTRPIMPVSTHFGRERKLMSIRKNV